MKNLSLILNVVLLIAVAVLYYFKFSAKTTAGTTSGAALSSEVRVAFVNTDSILKYYDYFKDNTARLEAKGKKLDQDLRNRAQSFQSEYDSYQRNVSNLTIGQAKAVEEDLGKKQQNLQLYQQSLNQEISNDEAKLRQNLYLRITTYLKTYAKDKGFQMIFKFDPTSDVLFGHDALDVTSEVTTGLNAGYQTEKASGAETKKDSAAAKKK
jgi:outer membrane protein